MSNVNENKFTKVKLIKHFRDYRFVIGGVKNIVAAVTGGAKTQEAQAAGITSVAQKAIAMIQSVPTQEEQMQYARSIRFLKKGWTNQLKEDYFNWFLKAANYRGGASFAKFVEFIRDDAVASLTNAEKESLAELLAKK